MILKLFTIFLLSFLSLVYLGNCKGNSDESGEAGTEATIDPMKQKGIGPIKSFTPGELNEASASKGKEIFEMKCSACHKMEEKVVGPALNGLTTRRTPEWILNMILNPTEMLEKDPIAQDLLATYLTQMTFQNISEDEAKQILEYFRKYDSSKK